jgi:hypothetical protein
VEAQVLCVERDQLGAAQRPGEPQQQRAIAEISERACVDEFHHPRERLQLKGPRLRCGRMPRPRRIPASTAATVGASHGLR